MREKRRRVQRGCPRCPVARTSPPAAGWRGCRRCSPGNRSRLRNSRRPCPRRTSRWASSSRSASPSRLARRRRGREDCFVDTQKQGQLQLRVARAVNGSDQHLVERRRNHPHAQSGQTRFQDGQPVSQRQRLPGEGQPKIFQPLVHLLPDGGVDGAFPALGGAPVLRISFPPPNPRHNWRTAWISRGRPAGTAAQPGGF